MKPEWETTVQCGLKTLVPTGKCWVLYAGDPEEAREAALETANRLCNGKSEPEGWNRPNIRRIRFREGMTHEEFVKEIVEGGPKFCAWSSENPSKMIFVLEDIDRADVLDVFGELLPSPNDLVCGSRFSSRVMDINDDWFIGPDLVYFIATMDASRADKLPQEGFLDRFVVLRPEQAGP